MPAFSDWTLQQSWNDDFLIVKYFPPILSRAAAAEEQQQQEEKEQMDQPSGEVGNDDLVMGNEASQLDESSDEGEVKQLN